MNNDLMVLKDRLKIPEIWRQLILPCAPAGTCRTPWRVDHNPSFSVFDEDRRCKDLANGEGGDAVDFIEKACHVYKAEVARRFRRLAGGSFPHWTPPTKIARAGKLFLPSANLEGSAVGTKVAFMTIAHQRGLDFRPLKVERRLPL